MQRGRGRGKPDNGAPKSNYGGGSFNYGGGASGNGNGGGNFGQGFGSNPDWLSQQNSGYSGQNNYDSYGATGYDQSGGYNQSYGMDYSQGSYNNYSNDYSGYNSQPQFGAGFNRPAGGQRGGRDGRRSEQSRDRRSSQTRPKGGPLDPRGKRPEKRSKKPSESRESKPAPVVKILAQLKECPFGVNVYQSHNKKLPITEKEFTEIMSTINQNWMVEMDTSEEKLKVEGSEWYKNRGIILCQDEFSRKWVQKSMETIEIGGRQFKAWAVGEFGDVVDVSVFLGSALDSCPDPKDVIVKALKNSEVEFEKVEVVNVTKNDKGRLVNLLMDGKCINTLKFKKNGKIFAGLAELKFEF